MRFTGHQQDEQQVYGHIVRGIESDRVFQGEQCTQWLGAMLHPTVGNGNTLAEPGATQFFPGNQLIQDLIVG